MNWKRIIASVFILLVGFSACKKSTQAQQNKTVIKNYNTYEAEWKSIEKMEKKGLGNSIIEKVDSILTTALAEENTAQIFKALAYRSKYSNQIKEESTLEIFTAYEDYTTNANFPLKQLLHSATAELYYQYYNQNRWKFQNRTQTQNFDKQDIESWSLEDILRKVNQHYQLSLTEKQDLLSYPIDNLEEILHLPNVKLNQNQFDGKYLQPTLFDFLANRALSYYKTNEGRVTTPQNEFKADDFPVFSSAEVFSKLNFNSTDSNSNDLKTALLFQELISAHLNDQNKAPLLHIELNRLRHYYASSNNSIKDSLYLNALQQLQQRHSETTNANEIAYAQAKLHYDQSSNYDKLQGEKYRWSLKQAHEICKSVTDNKSFGAIQCANLAAQIEAKSLRLQTEKVYLPTEKIQYKIEAKNINQLYFKLIKIPNSIENIQRHYESTENLLKRLFSIEAAQKWVKPITNPGDFRAHTSVFSTDKLQTGRYILIASTAEAFHNNSAATNFIEFQVSDLAFLSKNENKGAVDFYAVNRTTGEPISNATFTSYFNEYNYNTRKTQLTFLGKHSTNNEGFVRIQSNSNTRNFKVQLTSEKDTLNNEGAFYSRRYNRTDKKRIQSYLFSDRAIYRPGQTVYFKGIVVERGKNSNEIQTNYPSVVSLKNVNGEEVSKLTVKTNDYGSYQGSFTFPSSGLNGTYRLQTKGGNLTIQVEEYKRPTFEVTLDTSKASPKINQNVSVTGNAIAFSGAKVSGAKINYRIQRRTSFPWWGFWWRPMPRTADKEIANGKITADDDGKFTIEFFAEADETVASKWNPNYNFEISINATSPSGETQSLVETITLGTKEIYLSSNLGNKIQLEALKNVVIQAKNIQGVELNEKLNFSLYRLKTPQKAERQAYWEEVDYPDVSEKTAVSAKLHEFNRGAELLKGYVESNKTNDLIGSLPVGAYEIVATAVNGKASEFSQRFELFDERGKQLATPTQFSFTHLKMKAEPGENASFLIGSSLSDLKLLYEVHVDGKRITQEWISLKNEQRKIEIPIQESYRGGVQISFIGVNNNREFRQNTTIAVPFSNKKLELTLGTYRNKVQPGSKEKWTMTINGHKGEKLAAELLAGMYDQSLDQFRTQNWEMSLYNSHQNAITWTTDGTFGTGYANSFGNKNKYYNRPQRIFPSLNWFGFNIGYSGRGITFIDGVKISSSMNYARISEPLMEAETAMADSDFGEAELKSSAIALRALPPPPPPPGNINSPTSNPIRSDFRETAFFFPQLRTDKNGSVSFEFEMPDALTKWKFRALAHTKNLKVGTTETTIQTQKELMVSPTIPRFFREGDELNIKVLVTNLSDQLQNGTAQIQFFDAFTNQPIQIANGSAAAQPFNLFTKKNTALTWSIRIPNGLQAIKYVVTANSERFSDGEEKVIPVLPNRKLVTESLPLAIRGNQQKQFVFDKLIDNSSKTLTHESFTLEFTANPAWYAVQALPYVVESTSECSEQIFTRLYANLLAQKIATSNPRIKEVFELWKGADSKELTSKLMQNQELKSILIEETPWLRAAKSETEQKKRIALLFDFNKMASEKAAALQKLKQLQLPNGGWAWYKGMRDNRYITQYIIEGFGHLKQLGVDLTAEPGMKELLNKGISYLDDRIVEDYDWLKKHSKDLSKNHLGNSQIHYLYTRSFFLDQPLPKKSEAFDYYLKQAEQYWLERNLYVKGMQALAVKRLNPNSKKPKEIVESLRDNALQTEQMGMYWKSNQAGYYWQDSPIETQAMMVEVFHEIAKDKNAVDELRIWLLKEKQTQMWSNSKATALACYALLIDNVKALSSSHGVQLKVGKQLLNPTKVEAGTGYFKQVWNKNEVRKNLGAIEVNKTSDGIAWGAAYWQYYEDLDKITAADVEEFSVSKTLFKVVVDGNGEKMIPIDAAGIEIGDKIRIRLRIESKRNLEFVHVKDMRASGFEPINVISQYKYQDGLGYYESTKDASTNFFMDRMNKGVYVFEYDLRATVSGQFSNGICTLQCQYAPEFATHSKGKQLKIKN